MSDADFTDRTIVVVGGDEGHVRKISVRATEIETFDRASLIVPNSDLIAGVVLNRTHMGLSGRLVVPVSVAYDSDPREVERLRLHPRLAEAWPTLRPLLSARAELSTTMACSSRARASSSVSPASTPPPGSCQPAA